MLIRPVDHGDVPRVAVLLGQLGYPSPERNVRDRLDYWLPDPASVLLGADDGGLLGVAAVHVTPMLETTGRFARLVALVVDETARGCGVGRLLVTAAEDHARAAGCLFMEVTSSLRRDGAHRFYEGLGYADTAGRSRRFIRPLT